MYVWYVECIVLSCRNSIEELRIYRGELTTETPHLWNLEAYRRHGGMIMRTQRNPSLHVSQYHSYSGVGMFMRTLI